MFEQVGINKLGSIVFNGSTYRITSITVSPKGKKTIELVNLTTSKKETMNYYNNDYDFFRWRVRNKNERWLIIYKTLT